MNDFAGSLIDDLAMGGEPMCEILALGLSSGRAESLEPPVLGL